MVAYGVLAAYIALACGLFFFGYALRYYVYVVVILFLNVRSRKGTRTRDTLTSKAPSVGERIEYEPLVSIHLPVFNEPNVVERLLACCSSLDYKNYEVILLDDSTDHTILTLRAWAEANQISYSVAEGKAGEQIQVTNTLGSMQIPIKIVHRTKRSGFKGGALNEALKYMNPETEYVMVFDADFIAPTDIIRKSLEYFALPSGTEVLSRITDLDQSYASGKIDIDHYVKERERLAAKLRGNTAITESSKIAMQSLFKLDQLYAIGQMSGYEYKIRRAAIEQQMKNIPIASQPYVEQPLALHRAYTISQLFAENKIDSADYRERIHAIFAPFNGKPHPTNQYDELVLEIVALDRKYADGDVCESEYTAKRKDLITKLDGPRNSQELAGFESKVNEAKIGQAISLDNYQKERVAKKELPKKKRNHGLNETLSILRIHGANETNRTVEQSANGRNRGQCVAVQGYQLHSLNQNENWLTAGVRAEYSGSYMIERPAQEFFGSMKMISGSVYMIRADILCKYRWSNSITEDWELTNRLYLDGMRVAYTPTIEAAAESPATLKRLLKQRQRWAEGHSFNVKKYFWRFMTSPNTTLTEKLEYLYYAPYYIQGLFLCVGTTAWIIQLWTQSYLPFWTALFGWGLLLSNSFAIPLMNFAGLASERPRRRDVTGVMSAFVLSYIVAFFQGYAALKGFLEPKEGEWVRTFKSGKITQAPVKIQSKITLQPVSARTDMTPQASS